MNGKQRIGKRRGLVVAAIGVGFLLTVGAALATPGMGILSAPVQARGTLGPNVGPNFVLNSKSGVHLKALGSTDVVTQQIRIAPGGHTGWHSHPGPVLVTVEYVINRECTAEFNKAMHRYGRTRRRDGASQWGIFRDTEDSNRYLEMFLVNSWGEHLRQHERITKADRELEERIRSYTLKEPTVRHLIYAAPP